MLSYIEEYTLLDGTELRRYGNRTRYRSKRFAGLSNLSKHNSFFSKDMAALDHKQRWDMSSFGVSTRQNGVFSPLRHSLNDPHFDQYDE